MFKWGGKRTSWQYDAVIEGQAVSGILVLSDEGHLWDYPTTIDGQQCIVMDDLGHAHVTGICLTESVGVGPFASGEEMIPVMESMGLLIWTNDGVS